MASHRADRPARRRTSSGRAVTSSGAPRRGTVLAVASALLVGLLLGGSQGSLAFWTDRDSVAAGSFSTGKLDLTLDGQQGNPTAYVETELAMTKMVPGESVSATVNLVNAGDASLTWVPTVTAGGVPSGTGGFQVTMQLGATAGLDDTTYPRTEGCTTGGTVIASGGTNAPVLAPGGVVPLCVVVTLPENAGNSMQTKTDYTLTIRIDSTQKLS